MTTSKKYGLGLVMSGGGVKGMVHAGVLKYLHEEAIPVDIIAGASVGAMVGSMYAAGHTPTEIRDFFINTSFFNTTNLTLRKPGLIDSNKLKKQFSQFFPEDDFSALPIPVYITATEITRAEMHVFKEGSIIDAIFASSAFPLVFAPIELDGKLYLDGGIMNHFPADLLKDECRHLIGIFLSPVEMLEKDDLKTIPSIIERTFRLGRLATSIDKMKMVDLLINPKELIEYNTFSIRNSTYSKLFDIGYEYARENGDQIKSLSKKAACD